MAELWQFICIRVWYTGSMKKCTGREAAPPGGKMAELWQFICIRMCYTGIMKILDQEGASAGIALRGLSFCPEGGCLLCHINQSAPALTPAARS